MFDAIFPTKTGIEELDDLGEIFEVQKTRLLGKFDLHSLKLTASLPLKIGLNAPKGNERIPTIHFQVRTVSFREGRERKMRDDKSLVDTESTHNLHWSLWLGHVCFTHSTPEFKDYICLGNTHTQFF